jgi:hypothetical protein
VLRSANPFKNQYQNDFDCYGINKRASNRDRNKKANFGNTH